MELAIKRPAPPKAGTQRVGTIIGFNPVDRSYGVKVGNTRYARVYSESNRIYRLNQKTLVSFDGRGYIRLG